jgi:hypothetical protein
MKAAEALKLTSPVASIRAKWNKWFKTLPAPRFETEADRKAYYKCWWIVRLNYYRHPRALSFTYFSATYFAHSLLHA